MPDADPSAAIAFGPIFSRRFGRSLGVNNIPSKHCSYSCVYCQVGPTGHTELERTRFYGTAAVLAAVEQKVTECRAQGQAIDVISIVPDGEPTLDLDLGEQVRALRRFGYPVLVITNGSLLWREDVRRDLLAADIVSIEVDTVDDHTWRRIDRSAIALRLNEVLDGMRSFAREFGGQLVTQTMLVRGVNDDAESMEKVAGFLAELKPHRVCLSVPTRPPADSRVQPPDREAALRTWAIFSSRVEHVEFLPTAAEDHFVTTGDVASDLLAALSVHPMTEAAILNDMGATAEASRVVDELVAAGKLVRVPYGGSVFLARA